MNERQIQAREADDEYFTAEVWREYDAVAEWCAKRGLHGLHGDPLPELVSARCAAAIARDPEAFEERVRDCAYALACRRTAAKCSDDGDGDED